MIIKEIKLNQIEVDENQPRKNFEDIGKLASNILKQGLIYPLQILNKDGKYTLIDGERRFRALKLLKKKKVTCIIIDNKKDIFLRQLSEDFHKKNLNLVEQAEAIEKLQQEGYSKNEICNLLGLKSTAYYSRLKILKLSPKSKKYIKDKKINLGDIHNLSNLDLANEERVIERIVKEKPKNQNAVRKILLEETDLNYMLNTYSTNCYNFFKTVKQLNEKLILYLSYMSKEKKDFLKYNRNEINSVISSTRQKIDQLEKELEWQEENCV